MGRIRTSRRGGAFLLAGLPCAFVQLLAPQVSLKVRRAWFESHVERPL
jgi:hypothetical protein